jgi:hypothetical protein
MMEEAVATLNGFKSDEDLHNMSDRIVFAGFLR